MTLNEGFERTGATFIKHEKGISLRSISKNNLIITSECRFIRVFT